MRLILTRSAFLLGGLLSAAILSGCNSKLNDYYTLAKLVMEDNSITLSRADLERLKNKEFIRVSVNGRATVLMQLTFDEGGNQYWRSGDGALIRINNGAITQTDGIESELYFTSQPLSVPALKLAQTSQSWERMMDVEGVGYGLNVRSVFKSDGKTQMHVFGEDLTVQVVVEEVSFPKTTPYITFDRTWQNFYYYANGELVGTKQKLTPDGDTYDMVFLNRASSALDKFENA